MNSVQLVKDGSSEWISEGKGICWQL